MVVTRNATARRAMEPTAPVEAAEAHIVLVERNAAGSTCTHCQQAVRPFFFEVHCACKESKRFRHVLSITGMSFSCPAVLLLRQRSILLGMLASALTVSTIVYHSTHDPRAHAVDVLTLWVTAVVGVVQAIVGLVTKGANACVVLALVIIALINVINLAPFTHDAKERELILLPWHVMLHAMCTASLTLLALGWGDEGWI